LDTLDAPVVGLDLFDMRRAVAVSLHHFAAIRGLVRRTFW